MAHFEIIVVIAAGGLSSRMGSDKLKLFYESGEQFKNLKTIFQALNTEIFISIRRDQDYSFLNNKNILFDDDEFIGRGPISGLLSANKKFPSSSILYLGCDYPLITTEEINLLVSQYRNKKTKSFFKENYEPLITLYSETCFEELKKYFISGNYSLKKFLAKINAEKIICPNPERLMSVDTQDEYAIFKKNRSIIIRNDKPIKNS